MTKQFTRTYIERSSSFVFSSSVGKNGLYIPSDYIPNNQNSSAIGEEDRDDVESSDDQIDGEDQLAASNERITQLYSNDSEGDENQPLLLRPTNSRTSHFYDAVNKIVNRRKKSLSKSLIDQERDLLIDNKIIDSESSPSIYENNDVTTTDYEEEQAREISHAWDEALQSGKSITTTHKRELETLTGNALPLVFTFVLQNSLSLASIFSVSHLGTKELGAVTLGSMTANITGLAAIQGLCTCLDTLCSQAYGGKNYHLVGILVQRCAVITIICFLPMIYLWWFWSDTLLQIIIPEKELCRLASDYLRITAFGVPGFILFECGKRFLQCQGVFHASTIVLFVCAPLNALMNYLLVWNKTIGIGYLGAPLSVAINYWFMALGLLIYTKFTTNKNRPMKCWSGLIEPHQVFKNWHRMFSLALPGIIMVEAEFLGFEILTIFSSHLGEEALAANSIVETVASLAYQIPFSISISASTRVANFIGASLIKPCIITCQVALGLSFIGSSLNMIIIFYFRDTIAKLFSSEPSVVSLVITTLPYLAFMQLFDAFNASTAGCLRGQGRQKIGGYINIFAFYGVGIPMAYILAFKYDQGIVGLWIGIIAALCTMSVCQAVAVFNADWDELINICKMRNSEVVNSTS